MRKAVAIAVCAAEGVLYAVIGAFLGWKNGGGIIPMMILLAVWGATWVAITKKGAPKDLAKNPDEKVTSSPAQKPQSLPPPPPLRPGEHMCPACHAKYKSVDYNSDAPLWYCSVCKQPVPKE